MLTNLLIFGATVRASGAEWSMFSAEGAAIDVPNAAHLSPRFQLMTENDRIIRNCRIVWTMQNRVGVIFE
jgi:hypothetical protein